MCYGHVTHVYKACTHYMPVVLLKLTKGQMRSQRSKGRIHPKRYYSFIISVMVM